jgi:BirA family biotin operon repressor/biotin-[acetyl-CoA-carboxylase] ligase
MSAGLPPSLETRWLGRAWRHLASCASTNDEAAAWAREGAPAGAVVSADAQERGRGRLGRRWHSGGGLALSVVLRPSLPPAQLPPVTLAAGVALAETIAQFGARAALKWPNDALVDGKKVAGILTETATRGGRVEHLIVGIGVNLRVAQFPDELAAIAGSLDAARAPFAAALCLALERWYERFLDGGAASVVDGWKRFAAFFGRRVEVSAGSERIAGIAEDLAADGALLLRDEAGHVHRLHAGELACG